MKYYIFTCVIFIVGCGASKAEFKGEVIAATTQTIQPVQEQAEPDTPGEHNPEIDELVKRDAEKASQILGSAMEGEDGRVAGYAAVYVLRLGLVHDGEVTREALLRGTKDGDISVQALCWRWLAADEESLPKWKGKKPSDPVVAALAALAYAKRGKVPSPLKSGLGLKKGSPEGIPVGNPKEMENLAHQLIPFDDGPLALVIGFVNARKNDLVELGENNLDRWVAEGLRDELMETHFGIEQKTKFGFRESFDDSTRIPDKLTTALTTQPSDKLRSVIVQSKGSLQIEALRALAVSALYPVTGDFAAAAAAMESEDPFVQVEAARTYLLFVARATEK